MQSINTGGPGNMASEDGTAPVPKSLIDLINCSYSNPEGYGDFCRLMAVLEHGKDESQKGKQQKLQAALQILQLAKDKKKVG